MSAHGWQRWLDETLAERSRANLMRERSALEPQDAVHVRRQGQALTLFSTNDYLGLSTHPEVREAIAQAARAFGQGPRGSALICGYSSAHEALERELAALKRSQSALIFPTGYAANMGTLTALASPELAIFSDSLNHASIIDGISLAKRRGAQAHIYPHADMEALKASLERCERPLKLIVTDTVFSMDGDIAPLERLSELKRAYGALLMVDDAHGTLTLGPGGQGAAALRGVSEEVDLHVGTLSKAIGAAGGFLAADARWCQLVLNLGRPYVYSTALPLPVVEGARAALRVGSQDERLRERLGEHIARFEAALGRRLESPIVPVILGDVERALACSRALLDAGFHVTAIRPPTVPEGSARLRVTLSAAHDEAEVEGILKALKPWL